MTNSQQLERPKTSPGEGSKSQPAVAPRPWRARTVVVGIDGSASAQRALERAGEAVADDGLLVLVAVETELFSHGVVAAPLLDAQDGGSERLLREAREQVRADCAACLTVASRGDPVAVLTDLARAHGAELLVVGRRGRDYAARVLLGSVAKRVIAEAPCDVLVVA